MNTSTLRNTRRILVLILMPLLVFASTSCKCSKFQAQAVKPFDSKKYLGTWYEIARFDFKYERDLKNVTAQYSEKKDGKIKVVNKGYDTKNREWKSRTAKAKFAKSENQAALKVSFFGSFYSEYNVVMLSEEYQTALVFGKSTKYMWILSRKKTIDEKTKQEYLSFAKSNGFPIENLVWTVQE
jgi:apolipoprotein D and lipocalin family protein